MSIDAAFFYRIELDMNFRYTIGAMGTRRAATLITGLNALM